MITTSVIGSIAFVDCGHSPKFVRQRCKACYNHAWRQVNTERVQASQRRYLERHADRRRISLRRDALKRKYGLSLEDYQRLLAEQNGVCALCGFPPSPKKFGRLVVDHCHKTSRVRGLLCRKCNVQLSLWGEDEAPSLLSHYLNGKE